MNKEKLYEQAVILLAKRDYSSGEINRHLKQNAPDKEAVIDAVMERLISHHYLDDSRLIEKEIAKQLNKKHGLIRIKQELKQKELDSLLIEQALEDLDVDWFELAEELRVKKFGNELPKDEKEKAKQIRYLQYRGYSLSIIINLLSNKC
ncbi:regulatory protein RecX [Aliivibrio sifiae]|uniref:Regulatory protein RecX n=1 Tax=Aliivibrio sifiae TaxID=566293 RepID=A0A2S7X1C8_9GAMM|nr:regulatory protein RecX [Aliivibrio sifiae]PQJ83606.1 RecX family transcriptional regulator [Aliivibrio sifiae]GLR76752.1 regulatory protein RecX [Aliivibrio sifiae]